MNEEQVRQILRKRVERKGLRGYAREIRVSAGYLSRVVNGKKPISGRVLDELGFKQELRFFKA